MSRGHAAALLELERPAGVGRAGDERRHADDHDQQQSNRLDRRKGDVQTHRLDDPAVVDGRHEDDEHERHEQGRQLDEGAQVVAAEGSRERARGGDPRGHDREGDEEGHERDTEGAVDVQRGRRRRAGTW
jgi:hypothetical protein